jgi:hypothetical protein
MILFALAGVEACLLPGIAAGQHTQFVSINASPAPQANNCSIVKSKSDLMAQLTALHSTSQQIPAVDFSTQSALVVTTLDAWAKPGALGPSASNPKILLLTFTPGPGAAHTGLFVFAVDASYAAPFNGCQVLYPGHYGTIRTSSGPS